MTLQNRRDFLRLSATLAAAAGVPSSVFAEAPARSVRGWTTFAGSMYRPIDAPQWTANAGAAPEIQLQPERTFQDILGFGGAFTDASCYLMSRMDARARAALLQELYGSKGLNFSMARTSIGSSDYSLTAYSYDDTPEPDVELAHFSIDHDRAYILPTLREAMAVNPTLFLFGSPWSPPGWMKASHSLLGGNMRDHYFPSYAQYFVKYLRAYAEAGVPVNAVTVQNEVDTDQDGRMPQAEWGQEYELKFVSQHLGPALEQAGLKTKVWFLDHNYNLWGRVVDCLSDPDFYKYVDGVAWHGYVGSVDAMTRVHDMFPAKSAYLTECGPDLEDPQNNVNWTHWSSVFTGVLRNWGRSVVTWNLLLDENGKPNIGPFFCGGLVTIDSKTKQLSRCGQYYAFAHFSKSMQRGAKVFATSGAVADVDHVAAQNPDGSRVLVLTNRGAARTVRVGLGGQELAVAMAGDSVTTLVW